MLVSPRFPDFLSRHTIGFAFATLFGSWGRTEDGLEELERERGGKALNIIGGHYTPQIQLYSFTTTDILGASE